MAKDLDDGFTRIANEVLEDLARCKFFCVKSRVVLCILRNTYGWRRKESILSASYIAKATGLDPRMVWRALAQLKQSDMITRDGSSTAFNKYWVHTPDKSDSPDKSDTDKNDRVPPDKSDTKPLTNLSDKKEKKEKERKNRSALPENATMNLTQEHFAAKHGMVTKDEQDFEWEKFKAHHLARGSTFVNWDRAWLTWVLNWTKFTKGGKDGKQASRDRIVEEFLSTVE